MEIKKLRHIITSMPLLYCQKSSLCMLLVCAETLATQAVQGPTSQDLSQGCLLSPLEELHTCLPAPDAGHNLYGKVYSSTCQTCNKLAQLKKLNPYLIYGKNDKL